MNHVTNFPGLTNDEFFRACEELEMRCFDRLNGCRNDGDGDGDDHDHDDGEGERKEWTSVRFLKYGRGVEEGEGEGEGELVIRTSGRSKAASGGGEVAGRNQNQNGIENENDNDNDHDGIGSKDKQRAILMRDQGDGFDFDSEFDDDDGDGDIHEDNDEETLVRAGQQYPQQRPEIVFSIVLSPTYRVPVLWFSLPSSPAVKLSHLNDIYNNIVPTNAHDALKSTGVMGGISIASHPISDRPAFFIHPCNTQEALRAVSDGSHLTAFEYLLLWFGIVGSSVGLHVPSNVVGQ